MDGNFLGPFSGDYCMYFYVLTVISLIGLGVSLVNGVFLLSKKKVPMGPLAVSVIASGVIYFQNRLLYSMCVASLANGN